MSRQRLPKPMACLGLIGLLLVGCGGMHAESTATPSAVLPTGTPGKITVSADYHRFKLGGFECVCLSDGSYDYRPESFFSNAPAEEVEEALRQRNLPTDSITTPYTHLYVNTGEHRVLVDMGAGKIAPSTGKLLDSMSAAGIKPAQIDTIVITHAHPDHIGGALDGKGNPIYTNASYYISRDEWSFWFSEEARANAREFVSIARRNLEPLQDRVNLVEGESEIVPGIRVIPAPGHTPGHMVVEVSSGDDLLLYIADTVVHSLHLEHPDWLPIYDILPEETAASKRRIFDLAGAEKALVIGQQIVPFPSLGTVVRSGEGWQWQPIEVTE